MIQLNQLNLVLSLKLRSHYVRRRVNAWSNRRMQRLVERKCTQDQLLQLMRTPFLDP